MSGTVNFINTGLVSQNYDVISKVNKKLSGTTIENLQERSSGKMIQMSDDEVKAAYQKSKNEQKTLTVDSSEIVNNIYNQTRDNITYEIDGVTFTNAEMKACKEIIKNAIATLPTKGSDLDYEDYAAMGIASNMVNSYAKENLTEEQAAVLNKSMEEYLDSLVQAEQESQSSRGCFADNTEGAGSTGELNDYYNVRTTLIDDAAESLRSQIANLPEQTRKTLLANLEGATQRGSVVQSASNKELSLAIKSLFENVDMKDDKIVEDVVMQYKELMIPVYQAAGIQNTANSNSLNNVLNQDISRFATQIANAKAVINNIGHTFSYTV